MAVLDRMSKTVATDRPHSPRPIRSHLYNVTGVEESVSDQSQADIP